MIRYQFFPRSQGVTEEIKEGFKILTTITRELETCDEFWCSGDKKKVIFF